MLLVRSSVGIRFFVASHTNQTRTSAYLEYAQNSVNSHAQKKGSTFNTYQDITNYATSRMGVE